MDERTCLECGKAILRKPGARGPIPLRCSAECKRAARRTGPPPPEERKKRARAAAAKRWAGRTAKPRLAVRADDGSSKSRVHCLNCGDRLTGSQRRFCSRGCREFAAGMRKEATVRICPVDGTEFTASNNRRFCAPSCSRRWDNYRQRHGVDPPPLYWAGKDRPDKPFNCEQCGKRCVPGENVAAHASRFCGRGCKRGWHRSNDPTGRERERWLETRWASIFDPGRNDRVAYRDAMRLDPCAYCGEPSAQLDHIIPRSQGGSDDWHNRAGTCASCNGRKQDIPLLVWMGWKLHHDALQPWNGVRAEMLTRT